VKFYLAGGFLEKEMISGYMRKLEAAGHEITCDWTKAEAAVPGKTSDADLTDQEQRRFAMQDLQGVKDADIVWHLVAEYKGSRGAYVEVGYALALRMPLRPLGEGGIVIASGRDVRKSIFHSLCDSTFGTHDQALHWLLTRGEK